MTPRDLAEHLARLEPATTMHDTLDAEAQRLAEAVRARLSAAPGDDHAAPWLRSGALRDSIAAQTDGLNAAVGSTSEVALYQEQGTARLPPRPFLAPAAAAVGRGIADAVGAAVAALLRP